jgi:hypothetical protein
LSHPADAGSRAVSVSQVATPKIGQMTTTIISQMADAPEGFFAYNPPTG